jgi:diguanylate cyclase (GGDEF)-like protein
MALQQLEAERAFAMARERNLHLQARRDGLTGLYNRRYLDETLPELLKVAERDGHGLAVAMIDLDHFKKVNDTYGHGGGDAVLRAFARIAESGVRESDVAGRYGGEEFCIVLLNCSRQDAVLRLEEMLASLCAARVMDGEQVIEGLSFSSGVAMFPADAADVPALLSLSDQRLYAAKQAGRRRVEAEHPSNAGA